METAKKISDIFQPAIKLVVGIATLLFIKILITVAIPDFEEGAPLILSYIKPFGNLVVSTMILLLLLNFGKEGRSRLNNFTNEKYWGDILLITIAIITAGLAHFVYKSVLSMLLGKFIYIYSVVFLVVTALLIIMLGLKIYKNLDQISGIVLEKAKGIPDFLKKVEK